jgi:hypothetical protein
VLGCLVLVVWRALPQASSAVRSSTTEG